MPTPRCRECQLAIPPNAPGGRCPNCLLQFALTPDPDPVDAGQEGHAMEELDQAGTSPSPPSPTKPAKRILGDYELLAPIGEGGMGIVWKARQLGLNRLVALKTLHAGAFASAMAQLRFRGEVETVARLNHPNIVTFFEAGEDDGVSFYTMALVEGGTLAQRLKAGPDRPGIRTLVTLISRIARAIHFAHLHGILHRDLKPSNVLLDVHGSPLVADFGLARSILPGADLTSSGAMLGSPQYMAPEQAEGDAAQLSVAADVYSLGAILYECVCGRPPFEAPTQLAVIQLVRSTEPSAPSSRTARIEGTSRLALRDLDIIALKCLRKDPRERYASAADLADELDRWLQGRPINARPVGLIGRGWRWCRREPVLAGAAGSVAFLLLIIATGALLHGRRMANAGRQISSQAAQLRDRNTVLQLKDAETLFERGESARAVATLASMVRSDPSNAVAATRLTSALQLRPFATIQTAFRIPQSQWLATCTLADRNLATLAADGVLQKWDPETGQPAGNSPLFPAGLHLARIARAGRIVLIGAASGNTAFVADSADVAGLPLRRLPHEHRVSELQFSGDGRQVATSDDSGRIRLWDVPTGEPRTPWLETGEPVLEIACGPVDKPVVAALGESLVLAVWDGAGGSLRWTRRLGTHGNTHMALSVDGSKMAIVEGTSLQFVSPVDGRELRPPVQLPQTAQSLVFSPDGSRLAVTCEGPPGTSAHIVDTTGTSAPGPALRHRDRIATISFSRDGLRVLTGSHDRTALLWDAKEGRPLCEPLYHSRGVTGATFGPDETSIVCTAFGGAVGVWNIPAPTPVVEMPLGSEVTGASVAPNSSLFAAGGDNGRIRLWTADGSPLDNVERGHERRVWHVEFSPDGRRLGSAGWDGTARIWDLANRTSITLPHTQWSWVMRLRFSPDGRRAATAGHDRTARVWDADSGKMLLNLPHPAAVNDAVFSPDGRWLLTRCHGLAGRLWDATTGELVSDRLTHSSWLDAVSFSRDGNFVLTASRDTTAKLWNLDGLLRGGISQPAPRVHDSPTHIELATLDPACRRIVAAVGGDTAVLWDIGTAQPRRWFSHAGPVNDARFDESGERIVTASGDGTARVWSVETGQPISEPLRHRGLVYVAGFTPDGRRVFTAGADGMVRVWPHRLRTSQSPAWLASFAEFKAALRVDADGSYTQSGLKSWQELESMRPADARDDGPEW